MSASASREAHHELFIVPGDDAVEFVWADSTATTPFGPSMVEATFFAPSHQVRKCSRCASLTWGRRDSFLESHLNLGTGAGDAYGSGSGNAGSLVNRH